MNFKNKFNIDATGSEILYIRRFISWLSICLILSDAHTPFSEVFKSHTNFLYFMVAPILRFETCLVYKTRVGCLLLHKFVMILLIMLWNLKTKIWRNISKFKNWHWSDKLSYINQGNLQKYDKFLQFNKIWHAPPKTEIFWWRSRIV